MSLQRSGEQHPPCSSSTGTMSSVATMIGASKRRSIACAVVQAMTFDCADSCPSRSAAAVAEQQCDETLRGGRTQLDVDGAVSGDRV
jgi:hypothetical protein